MGAILSAGYCKSIPLGQFYSLPFGGAITAMQTVFETRRARLKQLIEQHGTIVALNVAIGWESTNTRLSQIHSRSKRSDRGTIYEMGDATAREIEEKLQLPTGWMDTPPGYEAADDRRIAHAIRVMEAMPEWQRDQAIKILDTIAEPASAPPLTGT